MLNQPVPCTTVSDVSDTEAVEIFSRLNKGGTALSQGDVEAAKLARGRAVDVLKRMRAFVSGERPKSMGFGFSFAFRALVVFHRANAQFSRLQPDWVDESGPYRRSLADSWRAAEQALDRALSFVDEEMGWSRRALLPSANAMIVLALAFDKAGCRFDADTKQLYQRWLCLTALRSVFQGSVETTINRFCRAIRDSRGSLAKSLLNALKRDERRKIRTDDLNVYARPWGPETQVMHAWLVSHGAKDWLSADPIDTLARNAESSLPRGDLTVHHIFSRNVLQDLNDDPDYPNCPPNYALLSRGSNSEFGDKPADEVWHMLTPKQRELADAQFFGEDAGDRLKPDHYDDFCDWRAAKLAEAINDWLGIGR